MSTEEEQSRVHSTDPYSSSSGVDTAMTAPDRVELVKGKEKPDMHGRKRKARKTRAEHTQRRKQELDAAELGCVICYYARYIFTWNSLSQAGAKSTSHGLAGISQPV